MISDMSTGSCTTPPASSRVRSTKSPTSVDNSSIWAMTSARSSAISSSGIRGAPGSCDAISSSTLVRSDVSGVRSSWPASVTSRAWRSRDSASPRSIMLKACVRRASSSLPSTGIGRRSSVRATRSAASVSRATGLKPARATMPPANAAIATPIPPTMSSTVPKPFEHLAGRGQTLGDQQRTAVVQMHGQHALMVGGAQRQQQLAGHHVLLLLADGQRLALLVGGVDGPAGVHQHRVDVGVGGALDGLAGIGGQRTAFDQQAGPAVQLVVDVVIERPRDDDVDGERHQHDDHRDHRHREQHHPPAQ